jgi:hypothetical protein
MPSGCRPASATSAFIRAPERGFRARPAWRSRRPSSSVPADPRSEIRWGPKDHILVSARSAEIVGPTAASGAASAGSGPDRTYFATRTRGPVRAAQSARGLSGGRGNRRWREHRQKGGGKGLTGTPVLEPHGHTAARVDLTKAPWQFLRHDGRRVIPIQSEPCDVSGCVVVALKPHKASLPPPPPRDDARGQRVVPVWVVVCQGRLKMHPFAPVENAPPSGAG